MICPFHEYECGCTPQGGCPVARTVLEEIADAPKYNGRDVDDGELVVVKRTGCSAWKSGDPRHDHARAQRAYRNRRKAVG